jgi:hypothetical protein
LSASGYDLAANRHRPTDPAQLAAEVRRLNESGLTSRDIAAALRLQPAVVVAMLNPLGDSSRCL